MSTAAFLRYWIHQNSKSVKRQSTSQPCSPVGSDLSSFDGSEYLSQHTTSCHSLIIHSESAGDSDESVMVTSSNSATTDFTMSHSKYTESSHNPSSINAISTDDSPSIVSTDNSPGTLSPGLLSDRQSDGTVTCRHEEVVMAEVEVTPSSPSHSSSALHDMQAMTIASERISLEPVPLSSCDDDDAYSSSDKLSSFASGSYSDKIEVLSDL